jgi:DNA-binding CsgD family transcriptional regulator
MTRLLFLPDEETFVLGDSSLPPEEVVRTIQAGEWNPPEPYASWLAAGGQPPALRVLRHGQLVIIMLAQPLAGLGAVRAPTETAPPLSPRQWQVLQGLMEGLTTKQIARRLGISRRMVYLHVAAIKEKLDASTRAQSVGRAAALGWVKPKP